ncbi:MAG: beta-glucosidase [Treponema sp.]|nr:beta-glucosidase [Treponema sp.]
MSRKLQFPQGFIWGAASASYQVEGAVKQDGRSESIWDRYCSIPGMVANQDTGEAACDQYNRYKEDVALMKTLGLQAYRFSIAWPRVMPQGTGKVNPKGLDYYSRLVDTLLEAGIKPFATLFHWDLPQCMADTGGWCNPDMPRYFLEYAAAVFDTLRDRVGYWMTLNEPYCTAFLGHYIGRHAPGYHDYAQALRVAYYLYVAHGLVVQQFKKQGQGGEIGIALNLMGRLPLTPEDPQDQAAAKRADGNLNRWFLDPLLKGSYPADMLGWYEKKGVVLPPFDTQEIALMHQDLDFIGLNYYNDFYVQYNPHVWPDEWEIKNPRYVPVNTREWPITEQGLTAMLLRLKNEYGVKRILISENGTATHEMVSMEHTVEDPQRIDYLKRHLRALHQGLEAGVTVFGYLQWSFTDNFEWAFGYNSRFGLVYVDFQTQERIVKQSGAWYAKVIEENALTLS